MVRRSAVLITLIAAGSCWALVRAQDVESRPRRFGSLSERLERFRRDLLGEDRNAVEPTDQVPNRRPVRKTRPAGPGEASPMVDSAMPTPAMSPDMQRTAARPAQRPNIAMPDVAPPTRLQPQAARRATPGSGLSAPPLESVESAPPLAPVTRPGQRRPIIVDASEENSSEAKSEEAPPAKESESESASPDDQPNSTQPSDETAPADEQEPSAANESEPMVNDADDRPALETTDAASDDVQSADPDATDVLVSGQSPVLSVVASGPRKVMIGRQAHFAVRIRNTGATANNVVVSINIPHYVDLAAAEPSTGTTQAPNPGERREPLEWKIPRLDADGDETLNLKLVPRKSVPLDLAMQWTFTPEASQTLVEVQEPKLAMTISGPDEVLYGQSKIYKLTVSNPGNGDTENVTVGLMPIGRSTETAANHRLGTLRPGETKTIDIELTARQAGAITIKAQAFAEGGLRADAAEQVLVRRANLRIEVAAPKVKYAGTVGTYRLKIVNAGNAVAESVQVAAMLPPEAKYISSTGNGRLDSGLGKVTWTVGTLQPGAERLFDMQCALTSPGENRTQFIAQGEGDLSAAATLNTHVEALADLKLEVRDPQGPIAIGDDTVYEVHVRNRGTKPAEEINLTVFFSEGLEATTVDGGPNDISVGQVNFRPLATLGAGESAVFRVHARADKPGNHVFRAEVVCQSPQVKLAAEESTHFYGDDRASLDATRKRTTRMARREPAPAVVNEAETATGSSDPSPSE